MQHLENRTRTTPGDDREATAMETTQINPKRSRRSFIHTIAAGAGTLAAGTLMADQGAALAQAGKPEDLTIGVSTLGFPDLTNQELAQQLSAHGITLIQLFLNQKDSRYWNYNGRSDVSGMTAAHAEEIARTYHSAGIRIHSMGVYTNLIHPDKAEVDANLQYFDDMMKIGGDMGVHTFITEAGHFHDEQHCKAVPLHFVDEVWPRMVSTFKRLAEAANKHKATILVEPFFQGFFATAKRTRVFLEEVGSPAIRALLDPANLLELDDLEEMFQQLAPWIDCLHAKDRKLHTQAGVPAGQGDIDYVKFVNLASQRTPHAPLVLEYVGPEDYLEALAKLRGAIEECSHRKG
ncbi:MAG: sugar phosphate isomerase/epimerase [Candidatus Omnitrophica bacterium]|nr:sugar phosphate isomerase/epimerase [Candidatus Omnitrophota bacterium]